MRRCRVSFNPSASCVALLVYALMAVVEPTPVQAQADSILAQEGIYDRPFIGSLASTSIGGYVEGNTNYHVEDGVTDGFSMELRRFNIFLFSQVSQRVRFLSELEFEHGTEEIALETALVDVQVRPSLVIRAGILLPPIGYFNQNHDSPKWDFVERPMVSTNVIPATLSEVGGGVYGKFVTGSVVLSYDAYLSNGLGDEVVGNDQGRTDIPSGKRDGQFGEDNNGSPAVSGRVALSRPGLGEAGLSYYGGYYNSFRLEGEEIDKRRWLGIAAVDFGGTLGVAAVRGELAYASVNVPPSLTELFGETQWGGHLDVVVPLWRPEISGYDDAVVSGALRVERVDYNAGSFSSTSASIRDDLSGMTVGVALRPSAGTTFRFNYRYQWVRDFVGNPTVRRAGFQLGFATYF